MKKQRPIVKKVEDAKSLSWVERLKIANEIKEGYSDGVFTDRNGKTVSWELVFDRDK